MKELAILASLALLPVSLCAQNTGTGLLPFGSYTQGGFDTINNQNLNAFLAIPIASSAGRGLPLHLALTYNTQIFRIAGGIVFPATNWGWLWDMPPGGNAGYTIHSWQAKCLVPGSPLFTTVTQYSGYFYVDALGTTHSFPSISRTYSQCYNTWSGTSSQYATDATGYYMTTGSCFGCYLPSVTGPGGQQLGSTTAVDANGNYVTKTVVSSTETDWTDSVGNKALKILYTPSSTSPTQIQYQFLDGTASGGVPNYQTITLKLQSLSVKTNFACSGVTEYTGTATVPQELDIPTPAGGTLKYLFTYESYAANSTTYYTGRLQKLTLPTGGWYEYDYPGANDSINCADGTALSTNRVVSDGTNSATWNFVRNTTNSTTTVTTPVFPDTPNSNDTVYTFNTLGQETSRKIYKESPGVNVLRTVNTSWATNGTPASRITILEDGTTQSEVDTTFDSNGLLNAVTEYDWGSNGRGNPIRTTTFSYQTSTNYTSRNIINLVTSKVIKDGNNAIQYRQDITYDGVALLNCPTGVPQHDDTNYGCSMNYRGNPTSVTTYLTPATPANGITKNFSYDVFGNLLTAQLNCCQSKTWAYSSTTQ